MFTPGRYVVVDDEREELQVLLSALNDIGAACIGIHFTGKPLDPARFAGVRVLFSDLHLISGSSNEKVQFSTIENMLRTNLDPRRGGPYLLVLWTKHEETVGRLAAHLEERLEAEKKPISVLGLDKAKYILRGELNDAEGLRDAIVAKIAHSPQLQALLSWEADVLAAAGATLAEVGELVPLTERGADKFAGELDGVLSRLAVAAVGKPNVARDPRGAINSALAPLLSDRIMNSPAQAQAADIWKAAITRAEALPNVDQHQIGRLNRMLHLSVPPAENVAANDWGAVLEVPADELADEKMVERFGIKGGTVLNDFFLVHKKDRPKCKLVVLRAGAVCDYAQGKPGPIPYIAGCVIPSDIVRRESKPMLAEFESPLVEVEAEAGAFHIYFNARLQISFSEPPEWPPLFRLRESLLRSVVEHWANYVSRTGIIKWPM